MTQAIHYNDNKLPVDSCSYVWLKRFRLIEETAEARTLTENVLNGEQSSDLANIQPTSITKNGSRIPLLRELSFSLPDWEGSNHCNSGLGMRWVSTNKNRGRWTSQLPDHLDNAPSNSFLWYPDHNAMIERGLYQAKVQYNHGFAVMSTNSILAAGKDCFLARAIASDFTMHMMALPSQEFSWNSLKWSKIADVKWTNAMCFTWWNLLVPGAIPLIVLWCTLCVTKPQTFKSFQIHRTTFLHGDWGHFFGADQSCATAKELEPLWWKLLVLITTSLILGHRGNPKPPFLPPTNDHDS